MAAHLSTTAYAILGQLAHQAWPSYALIQEMRRNLHFFWPRAESGLYAEIKNLARLGLVTVEREYTGKRARSVYAITDGGREALRAWLATEPTPYALEFEALLKVFYGMFGSDNDVLNAARASGAHVQNLLDVAAAIRQEYLSGTAPFQAQVAHRAFVYDFLSRFAMMMRDWSARTAEQVAEWDDMSAQERTDAALRLIASTDPQTD